MSNMSYARKLSNIDNLLLELEGTLNSIKDTYDEVREDLEECKTEIKNIEENSDAGN